MAGLLAAAAFMTCLPGLMAIHIGLRFIAYSADVVASFAGAVLLSTLAIVAVLMMGREEEEPTQVQSTYRRSHRAGAAKAPSLSPGVTIVSSHFPCSTRCSPW